MQNLIRPRPAASLLESYDMIVAFGAVRIASQAMGYRARLADWIRVRFNSMRSTQRANS
jgi:hypothetical protein